MQRHFFLTPQEAIVYHLDRLGSDSSPAWSRHHSAYPTAAVYAARLSRPSLGLWFRAIRESLLHWFFGSRNRAGRLWT